MAAEMVQGMCIALAANEMLKEDDDDDISVESMMLCVPALAQALYVSAVYMYMYSPFKVKQAFPRNGTMHMHPNIVSYPISVPPPFPCPCKT
jgi:hypothetical protein